MAEYNMAGKLYPGKLDTDLITKCSMVDAPGGAMPLRDWLKHLAVVDAWPVVVSRLYTRSRRRSRDPRVLPRRPHGAAPAPFPGRTDDRHGPGGHRGVLSRMREAHSGGIPVCATRGEPINGATSDRMIGVLGGVLGELGTPPAGDPGCAGHYDRPDPLGDRGRARGHGPVSHELDKTVYELLTTARAVIDRISRTAATTAAAAANPRQCFEMGTAIGALDLILRLHPPLGEPPTSRPSH